MSDVKDIGPAAAAERERLEQEATRRRDQMLELAVRHLYGTALTLCRLTGGNISDAPRILVAAGAHSVQSLIEKLNAQQKYLETITEADKNDTRIVGIAHATNVMANDLARTMDDFEGALMEALGNMKTLRELEPDGTFPVPAGDEPKPEPPDQVH